MSSKEEETDVVFRCEVVPTSVVSDVLRSREGWREIEPENDSPENLDFNWTPSKTVKTYFASFPTSNHHVINHFKNPFELTRKDLMIKNVKRKRRSLIRLGMKEEAEKFGRICPHSFVLPQDYNLFVEAFKREPAGQMWIMKPVGRSQGKGIFLFHSLHQIAGWKRGNDIQSMMSKGDVESYVAQKYIANPHLVGGKKYDMRIYVLVTSYSPLVAWLYRDGFARFCISKYSKKREDMTKIHMHLTNNAIQKKADGYGESGVKDCKLSLQSLKLHIASKHGAKVADRVFDDIEDVIVRSLISVQKSMVQDPNCFELYGYDIMLDDDLRPWLLEANSQPSLSASSLDDYELKCKLIDDTLRVLNIEEHSDEIEDRKDESDISIGGFDIIWNKGPVIPDSKSKSFLACKNNASRSLESIVKKKFIEERMKHFN